MAKAQKLTEAQIVALRELTHDGNTCALVHDFARYSSCIVTNEQGWASDKRVSKATIEALYRRGYVHYRLYGMGNRYWITRAGRAALAAAVDSAPA